MKERPTNGQVIIVFTEHPILGILLIPYIAEKLDDGTLQLVEQAFHASPEAMSKMSEAERQAIHIASYYTEKHLMSVYSREKTVSRFLHKLSEDPEPDALGAQCGTSRRQFPQSDLSQRDRSDRGVPQGEPGNQLPYDGSGAQRVLSGDGFQVALRDLHAPEDGQ